MTNPVTKVVPVKRVNQGQPGGKTTDMAATLESELNRQQRNLAMGQLQNSQMDSIC